VEQAEEQAGRTFGETTEVLAVAVVTQGVMEDEAGHAMEELALGQVVLEVLPQELPVKTIILPEDAAIVIETMANGPMTMLEEARMPLT